MFGQYSADHVLVNLDAEGPGHGEQILGDEGLRAAATEQPGDGGQKVEKK